MRQAIHLLQLSTVDLAEYVSNELLENPLLEEEGHVGMVVDKQVQAGPENAVHESDANPEDDENEIDWERFFEDGTDVGWTRGPIDPNVDLIRFPWLNGNHRLKSSTIWS